ncbi:type II secretion system F family protein [Microbacterium protaetiae]|uniref:Type II secretion system F family protein n=1 Tax=Microbacterium protaetiae TaxID=2509458 RepID=A0A4P6ESU0_9MICO|nr:type II secretion system F family protein [Microbacterium protaetiae]QAY61068.1 type II secretion system F family protein [Microbacterium protaetiae]
MTELTDAAIAIVAGTALGVGVWLLVVCTPRWGAPSLERRIAPYIRDIADPAGLTPLTPLRAPWAGVRARWERMVSGSDAVARRLRQAGRRADREGVAGFRSRQLAWGLTGLLCGAVVAVIVALSGRFTAAAAVLPLLTGVAGAALCDVVLTRAARSRAARIEEELPTVLEFLALCLAAGEGIVDSLRRIGRVGAGELTTELRAVVLAVGTGSSLADALTASARGLQVAALTRSVDHIVAALERGAPLAQVLQAQATDAREDAKRGLIERAGRNEIRMMLPLVFLILPISVLFAIFPGVFMLRLGIG